MGPHMNSNLWPTVGPLLQQAYVDRRRAFIAAHPDLAQWPRRRSRKRKPIPGVIDALEQEG
jgi:hypothetical protein